MVRRVWLAWFGVLLVAAGLPAQHGMSRMQVAKLPVVSLPPQHNDSLLAHEVRLRKPGRPQTFAVSLPVDISPQQDGSWVAGTDHDLWRMRVRSPGAKSLNFGFTRFHLPPEAALYLSTARERFGPFTAADGKEHAQLWTPLLRGDDVILELEVPAGQRDRVELVLTTVNHDFEGAIDQFSDDCHLDVACGSEDGFPQIDRYRDVIRSVAAFTLDGTDKCTGFLVNNTNQDGRPLFLTANHCGVDEDSAPTIVTYWNFQNEACRPPGTAESGAQGNGRRDVFNTGARLLASYATTDMTLLELDEPVNPRANAFYAGWNALEELPTGTVFTIHHPNLDEKRISFSEQPVARSTIVGTESPDGAFLRVPYWELGSTEGGSSGAPLFDRDGLIRGQLFGGRASCGNDAEDMFGWFYTSWSGGGTPSTSLAGWLDPCGVAAGTLPGLDAADLDAKLYTSQGCQSVCLGEETTFEFTLGKGFPADLPLIITSPVGIAVDAPRTVDGGSNFTFSATPYAMPAGSYTITVVAGEGQPSDSATVLVNVTGDTPPAVTGLLPRDQESDIDPFVELQWDALAGAVGYDLQYSFTPDFDQVAANLTDLASTTYTPDYPLPGNTTFYWRVRADNACGSGAWSAVQTFTTQTRTCLLSQAGTLPVPIPAANPGKVTAELEITDDITPVDLNVIVGIEHTFLGDIAVKLVSPSGTEIKLFDPLDNGSCPARDLYVIFTDNADITPEAFGNRCEDGNDADYVRVQPLTPLAGLLDENARGTWKLVVDDQASMDGGAITDFRIRLCENRVDERALEVEIAGEPIVACANEGGAATLHLGADYTENLSLRIQAGSLELDNYTYTYHPQDQTVDVRFSAWTLAGAGAQELTYAVLTEDGTERRAVQSLVVLPLPEPVDPIAATLRPDRIAFRWRGSEVAERYTLEVAATEEFAEVLYSDTTRNRQLSVPRSDLPERFFWRVTSSNGCGSFPGPARSITLDTATATYAVDPGRSISIYPNPSYGAIRIETAGTWSDETLQATLFGADGRQFARWQNLSSHGNRLDLEGVPPGVYFLRVSSPFGQVTERLLLLR